MFRIAILFGLLSSLFVLLAGCGAEPEPIGSSELAFVLPNGWSCKSGSSGPVSTSIDAWNDNSGCQSFAGGLNLDLADNYWPAERIVVAGSNAWAWICDQTLNATPSMINGPGTPGPSWAPCFKAGTSSLYRRLTPGESYTDGAPMYGWTGNSWTAGSWVAGGLAGSMRVTNAWLTDPPACPTAPNPPVTFTACVNSATGTTYTSDSGRPEFMEIDSLGYHVSGSWLPFGGAATGAPCTAVTPSGTTVTVIYNCHVNADTALRAY